MSDDSQNESGSKSPEWLGQLPDELKGNETLARYKDVGSLAASHLETVKGYRTRVPLPGEDATPEQLAEFRSKASQVPGVVVMPDEMTAEAASQFLEQTTVKQALDLVERDNKAAAEARAAQLAADETARLDAVNAEWAKEHGPAADRMMGAAKDYCDYLGLEVDDVKAKYGVDFLNKCAKAGQALTEDTTGQVFKGAVRPAEVAASDLQAEYDRIESQLTGSTAASLSFDQKQQLADRQVQIRGLLNQTGSPASNAASVGDRSLSMGGSDLPIGSQARPYSG